MYTTLEALEAEALKLAPAERSRLAERLIASLDEHDEIEAAWDALADARETAIGAASSRAIPFDEAMALLESRFPG